MVQLIKAVYCFLVATLPIPAFSAPADDITSGINDLALKIKDLTTLVNALPSASADLNSAANLFASGYELSVSIDTLTMLILDESASQVAPSALTIISSMRTIVPSAVTAMASIVTKKQAFAGIASSKTFTLLGVNQFRSSITNFENALISKLPFLLVPPAQLLKGTIDTALESVIKAYSG